MVHPLELESQADIKLLLSVLGVQLRFSARAVYTLSHEPPPQFLRDSYEWHFIATITIHQGQCGNIDIKLMERNRNSEQVTQLLPLSVRAQVLFSFMCVCPVLHPSPKHSVSKNALDHVFDCKQVWGTEQTDFQSLSCLSHLFRKTDEQYRHQTAEPCSHQRGIMKQAGSESPALMYKCLKYKTKKTQWFE